MTILILSLLFISGLAEFLKDLSSEGKLKGYWDKNHEPMVKLDGVWYTTAYAQSLRSWKPALIRQIEEDHWWKTHWLQGPLWNWIPVWVRQYLSFRDGWHLLKFISVNGWVLALSFTIDYMVDCLNTWPYSFPAWVAAWILIRCIWSAPETIGRQLWK